MTEDSACARCGSPVEGEALFCKKCGLDVTQTPTSADLLEFIRVQDATSKRPPGETIAAAAVTAEVPGVPRTMRETLRAATLGEYEILGELGRGGMATVFLAHDLALDRKVAIKVMSPHLLEGDGMVERFKLEARTAAQLSHPHIIPIYAVKWTDETIFFVMKFVEGRPLDDIIKKMAPLPIAMVKDVLIKVGQGLGYGHRRDVVHRDIKPANIMIDEEGTPIVTDFGIAKVASEGGGLTMTGTTIGTPSYMSPEQCEAKDVSGASDQYSLGVLAYEMLTGKLPFEGKTAVSTMYKHVHEAPPPIQDGRPDIPFEVQETVERMLAKNPKDRWPTLEAAIQKLGTESTMSYLDPAHRQLRDLIKQGGARGLLARIQTPRSPIPIGRQRASGSSTAAEAGGKRRSPLLAIAAVVVVVGGIALALTRPWAAADGPVGVTAASPAGPVAGGSNAALDGTGDDELGSGTPPDDEGTVSDGGSVEAQPLATPSVPEPVEREVTRPSGPAPVASIRLDDVPGGLTPGQSATIIAIALDGSRNALSGREAQWRSSNTAVAQVDSRGNVTAETEGSATITVVVEGQEASAQITVASEAVTSVTVTPASVQLLVSGQATATGTVRGQSGPLAGRTIAWTSSAPGVATVSLDGQIVAVAPGTATITGVTGGQAGSIAVTVVLSAAEAIPGILLDFAAAMRAMDINAMRQVNPGMTVDQVSGYEDLFGRISELEVSIFDVVVNESGNGGATVAAKITRRFDLAGGRQDGTVPFAATFQLVGTTWRMLSGG